MRELDSWAAVVADERALMTAMPSITQAELLTAFGGAPKLERKAVSLSAVAEDAEPAGLRASALPPDGYGPIHPVAEHPPSASLTSAQEMYRPCTAVPIGGSVLHRQHSLGASILAWPAASAPLQPLSSVRATLLRVRLN